MLVQKELKQYAKAKQQLFKVIGFMPYDLEVNLTAKWKYEDESLEWISKDDTEPYSEDAGLYKKFDDVAIFKILACTGDTYLLAVLNNNEDKELYAN